MSSFYLDNDDLRFYVERWLPWADLARATQLAGGATADDAETETREVAAEVIKLVGSFLADEVAPHVAEIDAAGVTFADGEVTFPPRLQSVFDQIADLELHRMCVPQDLGGLGCPMIVYSIATEIFSRTDASVMAHFGFHGGIAMAMLMFSLKEGTTELDLDKGTIVSTRFAEAIEEIASGSAWGCMDITEPDAGSDMAALRARGEQDADGNWFVTGQKIFITSGHGKYHFVIARTEDAADPDDPFAGLGGLSFFLVPTYEDGPDGRKWLAQVVGVEEKLGHHASATCTIAFDRTPAHLIGQRGEGFKHMLTLMNNARIGVGFECIGLVEAAYRLAAAYAAERKSMGKTLDQHEMIADYLDETRTDVQGLRALAMEAAVNEELASTLALRLDHGLGGGAGTLDEARMRADLKRYQRRARAATPLLKYLAAEKAVEAARRCIQIHGGVGYTTEYGAEKLLRDAVVMPIYEGTSQIQALMATKDCLKSVMKNPQAFVRRVAQTRWRAMSARDPLERRVEKLSATSLSAQQTLITRTAVAKLRGLRGTPMSHWREELTEEWDPKTDFAFALLHAERLTRILCDEAIAKALWRQCERYPERRDVLTRWLERAEPRSRWLLDEIQHLGPRLLAQLSGAGEDDQAASA